MGRMPAAVNPHFRGGGDIASHRLEKLLRWGMRIFSCWSLEVPKSRTGEMRNFYFTFFEAETPETKNTDDQPNTITSN